MWKISEGAPSTELEKVWRQPKFLVAKENLQRGQIWSDWNPSACKKWPLRKSVMIMQVWQCMEEQIRNFYWFSQNGDWVHPLELPGNSFRTAKGEPVQAKLQWFYRSEAWINSKPDRITMQSLDLPCVSPVLVSVLSVIVKDSSFWPLICVPASLCDVSVKTFSNSFLLPLKTSKKRIHWFYFNILACPASSVILGVAHLG